MYKNGNPKDCKFIKMPRVNLQNLQQENGMLSMIKITQTMVKEMKIVQPLNLKPKLLNQIFAIIQTHIFL